MASTDPTVTQEQQSTPADGERCKFMRDGEPAPCFATVKSIVNGVYPENVECGQQGCKSKGWRIP
jgi:hypothetical protein